MKIFSPHILWPSLIITLLLSSVAMMIGVVVLARSDGGAQVVENYYQKATRWDEQKSLITQSRSLGWNPDCSLRLQGQKNTVLLCSFEDAAQQPVSQLSISATLYRPQYTDAIVTLELAEKSPGLYEAFYHESSSSGLWDIDITAKKDSLLYVNRIRTELGR